MYFLCINILYFAVSFIDGLILSMEDIPILTGNFSVALSLPSQVLLVGVFMTLVVADGRN